MNGVDASAATVAGLEKASVHETEILHAIVHGLLELGLLCCRLKVEGLGSRGILALILAVASEREEGGKLVPSEAELFIKVTIGVVAANIGSRVSESENLRSHHTCETKFE